MKSVSCSVLLLLTLTTWAPSSAEPPQEPSADFPIEEFEVNPFEVLNPDDVPEHLRPPAEVRGARVPYAVRAHSFLESLGSVGNTLHGDRARPPMTTMLENYGLDPDSEAAAELVDLAMQFSSLYRASLEDRFKKKPIASIERQHEMETNTYRAAGQIFGKWLAARETDGWAISPLIDRLLNRPGSSIGMYSSDKTQEELDKTVDDFEAAFRQGLETELGRIPRRFQ